VWDPDGGVRGSPGSTRTCARGARRHRPRRPPLPTMALSFRHPPGLAPMRPPNVSDDMPGDDPEQRSLACDHDQEHPPAAHQPRGQQTVACATPRTSCGAVGSASLMPPTARGVRQRPETSALSSVSCLTVTLACHVQPATTQLRRAQCTSGVTVERDDFDGVDQFHDDCRKPDPHGCVWRVGHHAHHAVGHPRTAEYCQRHGPVVRERCTSTACSPAPVWAHLSKQPPPRRCGAADHRSGNRSGDWTNAGSHTLSIEYQSASASSATSPRCSHLPALLSHQACVPAALRGPGAEWRGEPPRSLDHVASNFLAVAKPSGQHHQGPKNDRARQKDRSLAPPHFGRPGLQRR